MTGITRVGAWRVAVLLSMASLAPCTATSCAGNCGDMLITSPCGCDAYCPNYSDCCDDYYGMCVPTSAPTAAPTAAPTDVPTHAPTAAPSPAPACPDGRTDTDYSNCQGKADLCYFPHIRYDACPYTCGCPATEAPTTVPTPVSTTDAPTTSAQNSASNAPTGVPTSTPTSIAPTSVPTNTPTSIAPTSVPTNTPTSIAPTGVPTSTPTSTAPTMSTPPTIVVRMKFSLDSSSIDQAAFRAAILATLEMLGFESVQSVTMRQRSATAAVFLSDTAEAKILESAVHAGQFSAVVDGAAHTVLPLDDGAALFETSSGSTRDSSGEPWYRTYWIIAPAVAVAFLLLLLVLVWAQRRTHKHSLKPPTEEHGKPSPSHSGTASLPPADGRDSWDSASDFVIARTSDIDDVDYTSHHPDDATPTKGREGTTFDHAIRELLRLSQSGKSGLFVSNDDRDHAGHTTSTPVSATLGGSTHATLPSPAPSDVSSSMSAIDFLHDCESLRCEPLGASSRASSRSNDVPFRDADPSYAFPEMPAPRPAAEQAPLRGSMRGRVQPMLNARRQLEVLFDTASLAKDRLRRQETDL